MRCRLVALGTGAALTLAGCAVLTVDVDVYKGALANHESVQTEQMAAMAMGAKPLIAELRHGLERADCFKRIQAKEDQKGSLVARIPPGEDHPLLQDTCPAYFRMRTTASSVPDIETLSRDASRVNAILSLYDDASEARDSRILRPLQERLRELIERMDVGIPTVEPYFKDSFGRQLAEAERRPRAKILADRAKGLGTPACPAQGRGCVPEPDARQVKAVQAAWRAATDAWLEAMRLLSSETYRAQLKQLHPDALDAVATMAADLTSPDGLNRMLADERKRIGGRAVSGLRPLPALLADGQIRELERLVPRLFSEDVFGAGASAPPKAEQRILRVSVRAVLNRLLQEEVGGRKLAAELMVGQTHAEGSGAKEWFVATYPSEESLLEADESRFLSKENFQYLLEVTKRIGDTGLGKGRPTEGLETLIDDYLKARGSLSGARTSSDATRRRVKLHDALVNFAEKVSIIANFDALVRDTPGPDERNPFRSSDTEKYIRVLQAVGNSILSQVDALKQVDAHRERLRVSRDTEVEGIRNAEARAAAALKQVIAEVLATPTGFPDRALILAAAQAAQQKADDLVTQVTQTLATQRTVWEPEREKAGRWVVADEVVLRKTVQSAAEKHESAAPLTTADLARHLAAVLGDWEAKARLPGGAGEEEARRLRTAGGMLADTAFSQDTGDAGPAMTKYLVIVRKMGQQRDGARLKERELAAIVGDLERWHGLASRVSGAGAARLAFPGSVERGAAGSAKDVLDVMLATLRYEHVDAVSRDRNSELAKNRLAAVELLYAYRSGMVHIRPASTYLRNSYPATILQKDPSAGVWQNMLTRHAIRQLPLYDVFTGQKEQALINNTIDKQFWQSVNQVRVAGVGRTNYAIAKDDVGNWYVKSYSADPTDIIKSAKNLAMFSAGPALGANFLARGGSATRQALDTSRVAQGAEGALPATPGGATTSAGDNALTGPTATGPVTGTPGAPVAAQAPRSTLQRQFDRVSKRYGDDTTRARAKLRDDIQGLNARLKATLQNRGVDDPTLSGLFVEPDAKLMGTLGKDTQDDRTPKSASDMNKEIAAALRYVKRYRTEVQARLGAIIDPNDPSATPATKFGKTAGAQAKQDLDTIFKDLLDQAVKERQASTAQYDTAVLFIGETAGF